MKSAFDIEFLRQRVEEQIFQTSAMQLLHLFPQLGLRILNELKYARGKERAMHVPFGYVTRSPTSFVQQDRFDVSLESPFGGLAHVPDCQENCVSNSRSMSNVST